MDEAAGLNCLQYGVFGSLNIVYVLEYIGMLENVGATQISFAPTVLSEETRVGTVYTYTGTMPFVRILNFGDVCLTTDEWDSPRIWLSTIRTGGYHEGNNTERTCPEPS